MVIWMFAVLGCEVGRKILLAQDPFQLQVLVSAMLEVRVLLPENKLLTLRRIITLFRRP